MYRNEERTFAMARPREFDEEQVLDAATRCFWARGYELTSVRDLVQHTGITSASLYNAFGDKRALYGRVLDHYIECGIAERIRRCSVMAPRAGLAAFFDEPLERSISDPDHKGCMLINASLEVAPHDAGFREVVADALRRIEAFFLDRITAGQADGSVTRRLPPQDLAAHLLGTLMGLRTLSRVRPEPALLTALVHTALALLDDPAIADPAGG